MKKPYYTETTTKAKHLKKGDSLEMAGIMYTVKRFAMQIVDGDKIVCLTLKSLGPKKSWHSVVFIDARALVTFYQYHK